MCFFPEAEIAWLNHGNIDSRNNKASVGDFIAFYSGVSGWDRFVYTQYGQLIFGLFWVDLGIDLS